MMGRAEKRMAKKRAKKGPQYQGGRPLGPTATTAPSNDKLSQAAVCKRLGEVPVFGITVGAGSSRASSSSGYLADEDGVATFYMSFTEAEKACAALGDRAARVVGTPLDAVYFDSSHRLKPSDRAMSESKLIPPERSLVPDVATPLFCIDGMQTTDKTTGVSSLPLFFSRSELLEFAKPVYGDPGASERVLLTDLSVVTSNLLNGPAGLLRDSKFFAAAPALSAMDKLETAKRQDVFALQGTMDGDLEQGLFGGMKLPWQ